MLSISNALGMSQALDSPIDVRIKQLLRLRCDQLGGDITDQAHFVIPSVTDTLADLEEAIGFPIADMEYCDSPISAVTINPAAR